MGQIFILYFWGFVLYIKVRGWSTYSVILSSTLWIRPLFCLLWFYPLFQGRFVYPAYRLFVSIVLVWIRPLLLIRFGFTAVINLRLDLFWHKKEAAASIVCLTGLPCRFFWFSHDWFFLFIFNCKNIVLGSFWWFFHCSFADSVCPPSTQVLLPGQLR